MEILEVKERTPLLIQQLVEVWEKSVRATHLFLADAEVKKIKEYVPQALLEVTYLIVVMNQQIRIRCSICICSNYENRGDFTVSFLVNFGQNVA